VASFNSPDVSRPSSLAVGITAAAAALITQHHSDQSVFMNGPNNACALQSTKNDELLLLVVDTIKLAKHSWRARQDDFDDLNTAQSDPVCSRSFHQC
jgi:hypothetical protein